MSERARGRVVVVTGASAGVGRAAARAFGAQGARVALLARGRDGLDAARREIEASGGEALVIPTDVADPEQVEAAAQRTEEAFGPIDVWVNCAMVTVFSPVKEMTAQDYARVTNVTYLGYVYGTLAALRRMLPRNRGAVVQVSSALGMRSIPLQSAYCAAKHAVVGFTESLRTELLHDRSGVHVTMVHMPALNTPQFRWAKSRMPREAQPVPPIFQPEVAARGILYAADHPRRRAITVGGSALQAIFAEKIAPWFADRFLARVGYRKQMIDELRDPNRPDNLLQPLPGDHGAHGPFDARSRSRSLELLVSMHRGKIAAGVAALALGATTWELTRS